MTKGAIRAIPLCVILLVVGPGGLESRPSPGRRVIVVFDRKVVEAGVLAEEIARGFGVRVVRVYRHALRGCVLDGLAPEGERRLRCDPRVRWTEPDRLLHAADAQPGAPWGLDRVDQRDLPLNLVYTYGATGAGVRIYVLDTGVRISHSQFGGRASNGWDFIDNDPVAQDGHGHGTHVAGITAGSTYGVAKGASIVAVRVLGNDGSGTVSGVIAGVDWVTANAVQPAVANMSLGGEPSPALDAAVQNSIAGGVSYCVAAGNGAAVGIIGIPIIGTPQDACLVSPARVPSALTIGATDINDSEAVFSNYGTCVDLLAPGVNIPSAWNSGDSATATLSGTSMATPHVAGGAALYLEMNPAAVPTDVEQAIKLNSTQNRISAMKSPLTPNRLLYTAAFASSSHAVSAPVSPGGPATGTVGVAYTYATGGSTCNQGDAVAYSFDWDDGVVSPFGAASQSHAWSAPGLYDVTATARCALGQTSLPSPPLRVTIVSPGTAGPMTVTPTDDFSSGGPSGGPFNPPSKVYTVTNVGSAPMNWTAAGSQPWISATPSSGTLAGSASTEVSVGISAAAAPTNPGLHSGEATFTNVTTGTGSAGRTVTLTVSPPSASPGGGGDGDDDRCGSVGLDLLLPLLALGTFRRRKR